MGQNHTRKSKGEQQHPFAALWRHVHWISVCLLLLVAACAPAPAVSSVTPSVGRSIQRATITAYHGHTSTIFTVAWSPDGRRIASGGIRIASASQDGTVQVWDAATGHRLFTYSGHTAPVWAVAWSPGGKCIALASGNISDERRKETVQVWNTMTGHLLSSYPVASSTAYADGTLSVAWSPDSTHIASSGSDTIVHLWSMPNCHT